MLDVSGELQRIRAYVVGRLSDEERERFEDRLVGDPELVRELERFLQLREGLEVVRSEGYLTNAAPGRINFRLWRPVLAAAVVAGLGLFLWLHNSSGTSPVLMASLDPRAAGGAIAGQFTFVAVRGSTTPTLRLPPSGLIKFRARPATRVSRYRLILDRYQAHSATLVDSIGGLTADADGYVQGYADASRLEAGDYVLRIAPDPDLAGSPESFPFTLRRSAETTP